MMFQIVIILTLLVLALYAYSQRSRSPAVTISVTFLSIAGLLLAIAPEISNEVARFLGVGRGADLLFYCFILIALAAILNLHLRLRANHDAMTELARSIALSNARKPKTGENLTASPLDPAK